MYSNDDEDIINKKVYIPDFLAEYKDRFEKGEMDKDDINKELKKQNWLTPGLIAELKPLLPSRKDIITQSTDNIRSTEAYLKKVSQFYYPGRIFASCEQLFQASEYLMPQWATKVVHTSKSIRCFYSKSVHKTCRKVASPSKQRNVEPSLKETIQCPFCIRYYISLPHKSEAKKCPTLLYKCRLTSISLQHTCGLTTNSHRVAIQKSGEAQPNIQGLNDVVSLLRDRPLLPTDMLRPLLQKYLPFYSCTNAQFIGNFCWRVQLWIIKNGDKNLLSEDINFISKRSNVGAADEELVNNSAFCRQNLTKLLRNAMQHAKDAGTWDAHAFLENLRETEPGFDFCLHRDENNNPNGICWMLPQMRSDLLRYGNILFLDSQKKQYNLYGWPYIGPVVKDNNMKVRVVCESIVVEESHETYAWILNSMMKMEPKFSLNSVRLIFADQKITQSFICQMGIEDTCTLRGDYHHLLNVVWPETFGPHFYTKLKNHLMIMLVGTKKECEQAFMECSNILCGDANLLKKLIDIHNNPSYYAGWWLSEIEGNLKLRGSVPAEQNHSSITAWFGKGANWQIAEQVKQLISRQRSMTADRRAQEAAWVQQFTVYRSPLGGPEGVEEQLAMKTLSKWAFKNLYLVEKKRRKKYKPLRQEDNSIIFFRIADHDNTERPVVLRNGCRCSCPRRIAYEHQCVHEMIFDGGLNLSKYNARRWYHQMDTATCNRIIDNISNHKDLEEYNPYGVNEDFGEDRSMFGDDQSSIQSLDSCTTKSNFKKLSGINFRTVSQKADTLIRFVQSDRTYLTDVLVLLDTLLERARNKSSLRAHFDLGSMESSAARQNQPVHAIATSMKDPSKQKRKQSWYEIQNSRKKSLPLDFDTVL